jgi:hypothetical protein
MLCWDSTLLILAGDSVYTRCPKSQVIFDRPEKTKYFLGRQAHWFDVMLGQHSAHSVKVYIGQTGRSVDTRLKEHQRHIHLEHPDKSALAEHSVDLGHRIQFHNTSILATKTQYMDRIVREAIEIELHRNYMNREVGFCLSKSWKPLICSLKKPDVGSTRPCTLSSLVPRLLSQCPPGWPSLSPPLWHTPIPALACYLLAHLYDVSPPLSLLISYVAHSPSLPVLI